jgi:PAS domain S-box-containing protein
MVTAIAAISVSAWNYYRTSSQTLETAINNLGAKTRLIALRFQDAYDAVRNEAKIISRTPPIRGLMRSMAHNGVDPKDGSTTKLWKNRLETIFTSVMQANPYYTQMRYIGLSDEGRELVRVNRTKNGFQAVNVEQLQRKGEESYVKKVKAGLDTFFFSKVSLNREHGTIDRNLIPTIRAIMPVKNAKGRVFGMIVINVDFEGLMKKMFYSARPDINAFLTNQSGDYVEYDPKKGTVQLEYHENFTKKQPEFIRQIQNDRRKEAVYTDGDDIIYYARMKIIKSTDKEYVGAILRIPKSELLEGVYKTQKESLFFSGLLIVLATIIAALLAHRLTLPLLQLTQSVRRYRDNPDGSHLPTERKDELGKLAVAFKDTFDKLTQSESTRQAYVDASGDGYWDWLIQEDYEYLSPRFWEMMGYKPEEKEHKPSEWQKLIFKEDLKVALDNFDKHVKTKGKHPFSQEVRYRHKDGSTVTVLCKGAVIEWDEDGKPIRMIGTHIDLTEIKAAQEQLHLLQLAINNSKDLFLITEANPDNPVIVYVNQASKDICGYEPEELIGQTPKIMQGEKTNENELKAMKEALKKHEPYSADLINYAKDGREYWVNINIVPVKDLNGTVTHFAAIERDITDKKASEIEREKLINELERSNKDLDDFAYVASHDLKAPLRVIDNTSNWLKEDLAAKLDKDSQENLDLLRNRVVRMEKLLDDLLVYSRVGRVESKDATQVIDGLTLIEETKELLANIKPYSVILDDGIKQINVHKMPLQQVFLNLFSNAIKHGDKKPTVINVELVAQDDEMFTIKVQDNGPGIATEFHDKVFRIFQTLKPRDQVEGSGMGLAIVKKHVEMMGGNIKLDSDEGKGCAFIFTWPKIKHA